MGKEAISKQINTITQMKNIMIDKNKTKNQITTLKKKYNKKRCKFVTNSQLR